MRNSTEEGREPPDPGLVASDGEEGVETDAGDVGFDSPNETAGSYPPAPESESGRDAANGESLLSPQEVTKYRAGWDAIQSSFIDEPARAVEQADNMVDRVIKRLTDSFTYERDQLALGWDHGNEPVTTEEMRLALRGYRALLDRLLLL